MKVNIEIECSPDEARQFIGLPDVADMQKQITDLIYSKMSENITTMDPADVMQTWMPMMMQGWSEAQKNFWQIMQNTALTPPKGKSGK
jgi:hypothetical protein